MMDGSKSMHMHEKMLRRTKSLQLKTDISKHVLFKNTKIDIRETLEELCDFWEVRLKVYWKVGRKLWDFS